MKRLSYQFLLAVLLFTVVACASPPMPTPEPIFETSISPQLPILDPDEIALGKEIYAANCAECHGVNLEGEADWKIQNEDGSFRSPPHDETGHTWHHPDNELLEAIALGGARFEEMNIGGSSPMPAFGEKLTEEEITAVLTYIKSTWPNDSREFQWEASLRKQ